MRATHADRVRCYFDRQAQRFDAIYAEDKRLSQKLVDGLFRRVVHRRFELTFDLCGDLAGKRVLDIGCGSGRYSVECARRGAEVVGLDFAPAMIEMARSAADVAGVASRCRFINADFLSCCELNHYEICLAIGFFDYVEDPRSILERVRRTGAAHVVGSFPIRWTLRSLSRWVRLSLSHCPVHYYDAEECSELFRETGWTSVAVHRLSRDYLVSGRIDTDRSNDQQANPGS